MKPFKNTIMMIINCYHQSRYKNMCYHTEIFDSIPFITSKHSFSTVISPLRRSLSPTTYYFSYNKLSNSDSTYKLLTKTFSH